MDKVIIVNSEFFGRGDEQLGEKLMGAFLRKIWAGEKKPDAIIFYNSGVRLLSKQSFVLDVLNGLYEAGVDLLACGTCLDHYELRDQMMVGRVSNMEEIASALMKASSVVTI